MPIDPPENEINSDSEHTQERTFNLEEEFPIFEKAKPQGDSLFTTQVMINITPDLKLPLRFSTRKVMGPKPKSSSFTPFTPDEGYSADPRDKDLSQRRRKINETTGIISLEKAPLVFDADMYGFKLEQFKWVTKKGYQHEFPPDLLELVKRLRLELAIPSKGNVGETNYRPANAISS